MSAPTLRRWAAIALLDLNGDGATEIMVGYNAFESSQYEVYEIDGGEVRMVLTLNCFI